MVLFLFNSLNAHEDIKPFLEANHYLGNSFPRGCNKWFTLWDDNDVLVGVAAFGTPTGMNCLRKYGKETLELKRFALSWELNGQNYGSWFMAKCLKMLKEYNILSYSDPSKGFSGGIYRASNFQYLGKQKQGSTRMVINGRKVFAQSEMAKNTAREEKKVMYEGKKDIWFYSKRK